VTAHPLLAWAAGHPWPAAAAAALVLAALAACLRALASSTKPAVFAAGTGALVCTAYSGDTSWRFAAHRLGMHALDERAAMFAAGEVALLACAVMARANKRATATDTAAGTPGVPGVLVWCITSVQIIPAFSESGFWGGIVRAAIGPVMAGLLWHLAMGLEIRITRPDALSTGLPAQIGHELRERLLSLLGLAERGRDAAQMTRDRATARVVRLASREHLGWWGRAALKAAVARSGAAVDDAQKEKLLALLAGRRSAIQLRNIPLDSPWAPQPAPAPEPHLTTPLGVTGAQLRAMDPLDAIHVVARTRPDATVQELASLLCAYGVVVSPTRVGIALRAMRSPHSENASGSEAPREELHLDLAPMGSLHPDVTPPGATVHGTVPVLLTVADVARIKGVAETTVRSWVSRKKLEPVRRDSDGRLQFDPASVKALNKGALQ